jgi:glycosyltransferase involved in cell wall biosynthesis
MNVLQVSFDFDRGLVDAEELLARYSTLTGWSEALMNAGAERVTVLQAFHRDLMVARNGVEYVFHRGGSIGRMLLRGLRGRGRADLAHVNGLVFPLRTAWLRMQLPAETSIVVQDHASGDPPPGVLSRIVWRGAMRTVDAFMFTAAEQADPWRNAGIIAPRQRVYEVLEASTTLCPFAQAAAREMSGVDGAPAILWVGRLNANKDPLTVVDGFERCLAQLPGAVLTMVFGEADLLRAVQERLKASPALARRVRLAGRVPHHLMAAFFSAADLFVLGSHHEGSGYALVEACACGAVPVVTNIPTFRIITGNESPGALWTPGDAAGFARALVDVARRDLRSARVAVALRFARDLSWQAVGRRAMEIYGEVAAKRRLRRS